VTGDEALRYVVRTIQLNLRRSDLLARLGGDEFALLLPEQGADGATALLGRLQELLSEEMSNRGWPVTLSVGAITFLRPTWEVDLMIQQVDALMYRAKRQGKGRVEHAVVSEGLPPVAGWRGVERRAAARVLCNRPARVRAAGDEESGEGLGTVCNLSAEGVGLSLEEQLPLNTLVVIEPLSPGARTLLARVVRVDGGVERWMHGCALPTRLTTEELHSWLGRDHYPAPVVPSREVHSGE
jgi:hypothetical protein